MGPILYNSLKGSLERGKTSKLLSVVSISIKEPVSVIRFEHFQYLPMGWSYPDISMEDLMKLIKNFIDMLLLASGYQSSGRLAHWDSDNIKKSFEWALFLEKVSEGLRSSVDHEDSVKKLDVALYELTSSPHFPQGLAHLSCTTLGRARDLVLEYLIHPLPLRESHLNAILSASVQMDLSRLKRIDKDVIDVYLEGLKLSEDQKLTEGLKLNVWRNIVEELSISTPDAVESGKHDNWVNSSFTLSAIQQLERRQLAASRVSTMEAVPENLWRTIEQGMHNELHNTLNSEPIRHSTCLLAEELVLESNVWNLWRSRSLSYVLDKRTIRLISGASSIFSAPEGQWTEMFKRLDISAERDDFCETIELLLLGCTASKWSCLIEHLMSISYEPLTISRLCHEVLKLSTGTSLSLSGKEGLMYPKEKSVVEYLEVLLGNQINQLWKLTPVIAAVAIPAWSQLFRSYLHELECQFRRDSYATCLLFSYAGAAVVQLMQGSIGSVRWLKEFGVFIYFISVDLMLHQEHLLLHDGAAHCCNWGLYLLRSEKLLIHSSPFTFSCGELWVSGGEVGREQPYEEDSIGMPCDKFQKLLKFLMRTYFSSLWKPFLYLF